MTTHPRDPRHVGNPVRRNAAPLRNGRGEHAERLRQLGTAASPFDHGLQDGVSSGHAPRYSGYLNGRKPQNALIGEILNAPDNAAMPVALHKAEVGRRLKIAIDAVADSQVDVCRQLGILPGKLGNWLAGKHYPDPWFVVRFCDRYGVTADWIYRGVVSGVASDVAAQIWKAERETVAE